MGRGQRQEVQGSQNVTVQSTRDANVNVVVQTAQKDRQKSIRIDSGNRLHNAYLSVYGWLFKKIGFMKTSCLFGTTAITSGGYLAADWSRWHFQNTTATVVAALVLVVSVMFFQCLRDRRCMKCDEAFSMYHLESFKTGEERIGGKPPDQIERKFKCKKCGFLETITDNVPHDR
ncbi:hypothetical protein HY493_04735 [Candidatus Woesearchaeota archaeon]|nr:hypothetical protein [Candidatus Woesearchaeota archaeon]